MVNLASTIEQQLVQLLLQTAPAGSARRRLPLHAAKPCRAGGGRRVQNRRGDGSVAGGRICWPAWGLIAGLAGSPESQAAIFWPSAGVGAVWRRLRLVSPSQPGYRMHNIFRARNAYLAPVLTPRPLGEREKSPKATHMLCGTLYKRIVWIPMSRRGNASGQLATQVGLYAGAGIAAP